MTTLQIKFRINNDEKKTVFSKKIAKTHPISVKFRVNYKEFKKIHISCPISI